MVSGSRFSTVEQVNYAAQCRVAVSGLYAEVNHLSPALPGFVVYGAVVYGSTEN